MNIIKTKLMTHAVFLKCSMIIRELIRTCVNVDCLTCILIKFIEKCLVATHVDLRNCPFKHFSVCVWSRINSLTRRRAAYQPQQPLKEYVERVSVMQ